MPRTINIVSAQSFMQVCMVKLVSILGNRDNTLLHLPKVKPLGMQLPEKYREKFRFLEQNPQPVRAHFSFYQFIYT
jgi:hypothetical protein